MPSIHSLLQWHTRRDTGSGCFTQPNLAELYSTPCLIHPSVPRLILFFFQCPDATNLMFPDCCVTSPPILTPNQQFVILRNPVVSQPPQTGVQVSSIRLGSFPIPNTFEVGPITVNVPPAAVSMDLVGLATFTPATVRVPQDFPTIQLAVNNARPLDTIQVGPGRWCGARITKPLNLIGQ